VRPGECAGNHYYRRYRDSNASSDDFRRVMEENSGQDLEWFFAQWLHRTPSPAVDGGWKYNATMKKLALGYGNPMRNPVTPF
jgi:aminopeptidase N